MKPKLIVIEGTNASGKSSLGISLAARFGGEIVSADSRQVYRRLDLGSGKVTPEEMNGVPHHLLDVRDPGEFFSMADFQRLAYEAIDGILARGAVPFLVGGTGLYVDAVADGYELSDISPDHDLRAHLETFDTPALYKMLKEKLPDTEIDPRNRHRVMRALERLEADDYRPGKKSPRYELLKLGVTWPREILKQRIDERLERRLREGMVDERQRGIPCQARPGIQIPDLVPDREDRLRADGRRTGQRHQEVRQAPDDLVPPRSPHHLARYAKRPRSRSRRVH